MDCNCGRFFNSNSPPKSLKLYSPISIDSNDSQFNTWNDFDASFPQLFIFENELIPILKVVNRSSLSILKVCADSKQLSPISIYCKKARFETLNSDTDLKQPLPIITDFNDVKFANSIDRDHWNAKRPIVMEYRLGRSNHSNIQHRKVPRITNELDLKLYEELSTDFIFMDRNCGKFFNSKSPSNCSKLHSPISIDFNDLQFRM